MFSDNAVVFVLLGLVFNPVNCMYSVSNEYGDIATTTASSSTEHLGPEGVIYANQISSEKNSTVTSNSSEELEDVQSFLRLKRPLSDKSSQPTKLGMVPRLRKKGAKNCRRWKTTTTTASSMSTTTTTAASTTSAASNITAMSVNYSRGRRDVPNERPKAFAESSDDPIFYRRSGGKETLMKSNAIPTSNRKFDSLIFDTHTVVVVSQPWQQVSSPNALFNGHKAYPYQPQMCRVTSVGVFCAKLTPVFAKPYEFASPRPYYHYWYPETYTTTSSYGKQTTTSPPSSSTSATSPTSTDSSATTFTTSQKPVGPESPSSPVPTQPWPISVPKPCVCVPYYLCASDGNIKIDGSYLLELRQLPSSAEKKQEQCENSYVCCEIPSGNYYLREDSCGKRPLYNSLERKKERDVEGKQVAEYGEFPWQAAILKEDKTFVCGGVFIGSRYVITVAQKVRRYYPREIHVRLGEYDWKQPDFFVPVDVNVLEIIVHHEFSPGSLINNIALLYLSLEIPPHLPHIQPLCLPDPQDNYIGKRCWISGWGKNPSGSTSELSTMRKVEVPIVQHDKCEEKLRTTNLGQKFKLHPGYMCAGGEAGKDACKGDGGGPLACERDEVYYLTGLVAWGVGCGQNEIPGVYVNISYYLPWIKTFL